MAHTVILTRGILHRVEEFIGYLSRQIIPMKLPKGYNQGVRDKWKELESLGFQVRVCPVQLWDISYPKEYRDAVHTTLFGMNEKEATKPIHSKYSKFVALARKVLGLKKIDTTYKKDKKLSMPEPQGIEMIGIGVKDDYWIEPDGKHVNEKEKSNLAYEGI